MLTVKRFIFNPIQENTYVVYNGKDACAVIDPGCYFPEEKQSLEPLVERTSPASQYFVKYPLPSGPCFWE